MSSAADAVQVNRVFHDHECGYYDERFAIVHDRAAAQRAVAEVQALLGRRLRTGERVLDVGCGTGWFAAGLRRVRPDIEVLGADISAGMLGRAQTAGAWPLLLADAQRLPVRTASLDVVVVRGVLHHLPHVETALREWARLIRPDGAVVLSSEPTPAVAQQGEVLVRLLLAVLRRPLSPEEDFWEVASMAANLHVFTVPQLWRAAAAAGLDGPGSRLTTTDWLSTLVLTASYVTHGRRAALARALPWRGMERLAAEIDRHVSDRLLPSRWRHTIAGVLRPRHLGID